ncbi:unnamed protein product [Rotaria magnacalcarata]|uniref:SH3 domain-containing protein n=1 Tax=Rotaria magnacalcarata TaxID=392030 RepID=A0A8S2LJ28_9BILA|nr:unnamed protein product [Rotaria magnacalcarata]
MGNRHGGSRLKARDNKYKYPHNNYSNGVTIKGANGNNSEQPYSAQANGYNQHPNYLYGQSYGQQHLGHLMDNLQMQNTTHPIQYQQKNKAMNGNNYLNKAIYVANYDFNGNAQTGELSFVKGDQLKILDRTTFNDWWQAKNLRTKREGFVPANYISAINDLTAYEWYFTETNRRDAERFLEQPHNGKGTFLIRPSDSNQGIVEKI